MEATEAIARGGRAQFVSGMTQDGGFLEITTELRLPLAELVVRATPSGGPGGQHANRSSTRVEVWWDVMASPSLSELQRARLAERLGRRLDRAGRLRIVCDSRRSQLQNREEALARLAEVAAAALYRPPRRRATRPTRASVERRLESKRARGARKRDRRTRPSDE